MSKLYRTTTSERVDTLEGSTTPILVLENILVAGRCNLAAGIDENHYASPCSDPTSNGQISVYKCHPWIGNADTHSTRGFITEFNHTLITSNVSKRVLITIIWLKAI